MSDIAINPVTRRVQFVGNTGTGPYAFTFNILQSSDIIVYKNNVLLTETTDYTVTIDANGTGNVTMVVALVLTDILTMIGGRELSRTTDFVTAGDLLASSLNEQLDSNVIMSQQLDERFGRTIKAQPGDEDATLDLPLVADRVDKIMLFDTEGNLTAGSASDFFTNSVLGGNYIINTATGNGSQTAFGLTSSPSVKTNIQVYIDGVYQNKATFSLSGSTLTFSEAPPLNAAIEFMMGEAVTQITGDASAITYNQGGTGAQDRTLTSKLQDTVSVKDFGAVGDGVTDDTAAIQTALNSGSKNVFLPDGTYFLNETTMRNLSFNGLTVPTGVRFYGSSGSKLLLDGTGDYAHVLVVGQNASDVTVENITIDGANAYANGFVPAGLGGSANSNCKFINCTIKNIQSEVVVRAPASGGLYQREGGAGFVIELNGNGSLEGCSAINCQFGIRYAPKSDEDCDYTVSNFYAEDCEGVLNTTPSNFDNRDYAQDATYDKLMRSNLVMDGVVFKNCGKSTDQRTQLSFIWRDSSAETGGRASGNYHPWAGLRRTDTGTFQGLNWEPVTYSSGDADWSEAATYNAGDRVKITNDDDLGGVFCFGRVGGITISNVRGWNDHYSGTYPTIGAVFRGIIRGVSISNVYVDVACETVFHFGTVPSSTWDLQPFMISQHVYANDIFCIGPTQTIARSDMPWNGTWATSFGATKTVNFEKNVQYVYLKDVKTRGVLTAIVDASLSTDAPAEAVTYDLATEVDYYDVDDGTTRRGRMGDYQNIISGYGNNDFKETLGQTNVAVITGTGSPDGTFVAPVGSIFIRTDGGSSTTLYVKESGTGNTGWVAK